MRMQGKLVIGRLVFCALASASLGLGCGDSGSKDRVDSAITDAGRDAVLDLATPDTISKDAPADVPQNTDSTIDGVVDARPFQDTPVVPDATVSDGPADGASADGGADAGDASGDGAALSQAAVTFVLKNTGTTPLYLTTQCWTEFQVTSVADGTVYANQAFCMCGCSDSACQGDINCSPCAPRTGIAVAAGGSREVTWVAQTNSVQKKTGRLGEYSCIAHNPIATGTYRLSVPVFSSSSDATAQTNAKTINADFQLGTSNTRVEVTLQ